MKRFTNLDSGSKPIILEQIKEIYGTSCKHLLNRSDQEQL